MDVGLRVVVIAFVGFWAGGLIHESPMLVSILAGAFFTGTTTLLSISRVWPAPTIPLLLRLPAIILIMFPAVQLGHLLLQTPSPFLARNIARGLFRTLGTLAILGIATLVAQLEARVHSGWTNVLNLGSHYYVLERLSKDALFWRLAAITAIGYFGDALISITMRSSTA